MMGLLYSARVENINMVVGIDNLANRNLKCEVVPVRMQRYKFAKNKCEI